MKRKIAALARCAFRGKLNMDIVPEDVQTVYAGYIQQMTDGTFIGGGAN